MKFPNKTIKSYAEHFTDFEHPTIRGWYKKKKERRILNLEEIKIYIKSSLEWLNDFSILFASVVQPRLDGKVIYIKMQSILI